MPRPLLYAALILATLSLVPMAVLLKARQSVKTQPRIQVVYDMDHQSKYKTQATNELFADGRAMRLPPNGSVARGQLNTDDLLNYGLVAGSDTTFADTFPVAVDSTLLARGQGRFDIYCAVCHGASGLGNGPVSRRAEELKEVSWTPPTDLTSQVVVDRPAGHLYNTITNGIRNMPAYGPQITVKDRWAIVAYLRALQRARAATLDDVPENERAALQ